MKTQKVLLYMACLIFVISAGLNIYLYKRVMKLSEKGLSETAAQEEHTGPGEPMGPSDNNFDTDYVRELEYQLSATEEELDMLSVQLDKILDEKRDNTESQSDPLLDPANKDLIKKTLLNSIDNDYALLYEYLDLSPDDLKAFKNIVGTWRMDHADNTIPLIISATTDEEKEEARRQRQLLRDKYKEQYIELMGEEKYNIYNNYRMSQFDRDTLNRFFQTLPPEKRIDKDVMFNLIGRMAEERTAIEKEMGFYDLVFPSDRGENAVERETDMAEQVYEKYTEIGNELLPPELAEQYEIYIANERKRYITQARMRSF